MRLLSDLIDRIAVVVATWGLNRLFGQCGSDVRDEYPEEFTANIPPDQRPECLSCDVARVVKAMRELW